MKKSRLKLSDVSQVIPTPHQDCAFCENRRPFDLPDEILDAVRGERLVIFAGSGISTESRLVFPYTLYDDVKSQLHGSPAAKMSFLEVMTEFCNRADGRRSLLQQIKGRFD